MVAARPQVEGTCSGKYGFVIAVTNVVRVSEGVIQEGTGHAQFKARPCSPAPFSPSVRQVRAMSNLRKVCLLLSPSSLCRRNASRMLRFLRSPFQQATEYEMFHSDHIQHAPLHDPCVLLVPDPLRS